MKLKQSLAKLLLMNLHQFPGNCQGVIALNMEDGTLHRFRASNTILATGVSHLTNLGYKLFVYIDNSDEFAFSFMNTGLWQGLFLSNLSTHMYWRWKCYGCTCWFASSSESFIQGCVGYLHFPVLIILASYAIAGSWVCAVPSYGHLWCWMPDYWRLYISNPFFLCLA